MHVLHKVPAGVLSVQYNSGVSFWSCSVAVTKPADVSLVWPGAVFALAAIRRHFAS